LGAICVHLFAKTSREWVPVSQVCPEADGAGADFLCPVCVERFNELAPEDLVVVCVDCAREMRERAA
jgi:hypothetical protein